uniref:Uncharacterized protein n=1 Tax=Rhizophora mucronata TaxID=61149 RepID=A0A2P2L1S0_RHIMU
MMAHQITKMVSRNLDNLEEDNTIIHSNPKSLILEMSALRDPAETSIPKNKKKKKKGPSYSDC